MTTDKEAILALTLIEAYKKVLARQRISPTKGVKKGRKTTGLTRQRFLRLTAFGFTLWALRNMKQAVG